MGALNLGVVWSLLSVLSGNLRAGFCAVALVLVLAGCAEKNFVPGSPMARLFQAAGILPVPSSGQPMSAQAIADRPCPKGPQLFRARLQA
jgi:hypothetical protein